jgi:alpha-tubulin suppressor-like RCC1 family protein
LPGSSGTATLKIVNAGTAGTTIQSWGISSFTQPAVTEMKLGALVSPLAINQTYQLDIPSGFVVDTNDTAYAGTAYTFVARPINNQLYTFGSNELGQLGHGDKVNRSSPVQVLGNNWVNAQSTVDQTRAWILATNNGTMFTLGYNTFGNLGHNDRNQRSSPTQVPGTTWDTVGLSLQLKLMEHYGHGDQMIEDN